MSLCDPSSLEVGQVASAGGPGPRPVNPDYPDQRERERERGAGGESGRGVGGGTKEISKQKESRGKVNDVESNTPASSTELYLLSQLQQEAPSTLDSNRRSQAIGYAPV